MFGLLLLPVAGTFKCPAGGTHTLMIVLTGVSAVAGIGGFALFLAAGKGQGPDAEAMRGIGALVFMISLLGSVASSWIVNILLSQRRKK